MIGLTRNLALFSPIDKNQLLIPTGSTTWPTIDDVFFFFLFFPLDLKNIAAFTFPAALSEIQQPSTPLNGFLSIVTRSPLETQSHKTLTPYPHSNATTMPVTSPARYLDPNANLSSIAAAGSPNLHYLPSSQLDSQSAKSPPTAPFLFQTEVNTNGKSLTIPHDVDAEKRKLMLVFLEDALKKKKQVSFRTGLSLSSLVFIPLLPLPSSFARYILLVTLHGYPICTGWIPSKSRIYLFKRRIVFNVLSYGDYACLYSHFGEKNHGIDGRGWINEGINNAQNKKLVNITIRIDNARESKKIRDVSRYIGTFNFMFNLSWAKSNTRQTLTRIPSHPQGDPTLSNSLISKLTAPPHSPEVPPQTIEVWIALLSQSVSQLNRSCFDLVEAVLSVDWTVHEDSFVRTYIAFLGNLVSAHAFYVVPVMRMLANGLTYREYWLYPTLGGLMTQVYQTISFI